MEKVVPLQTILQNDDIINNNENKSINQKADFEDGGDAGPHSETGGHRAAHDGAHDHDGVGRLDSTYGHKGSGTADDPYQISTLRQWKDFAKLVLYENDTYGDKCYKLTADIEVPTGSWLDTELVIVGADVRTPFRGTLDGGGHTLTFNFLTAGELGAPFCYISGATISNLRVAGEITANNSSSNAAGIASFAMGSNTVSGCTVSSTIYSSGSYAGYHGGLVGQVKSGATLTISDCTFSGSFTGSVTMDCGGFVGYNAGTVSITDCLFNPSTVSINGKLLYSFCNDRGGSSTLTRAYRTFNSNASVNQGTRVYTEAPATTLTKRMTFGGNTYYAEGDAAITGVNDAYGYTGSSLDLPTAGVRFDGAALGAAHYDVVFRNSSDAVVSSLDVGTYTVTATGKGDYAGSVSKTFTVTVGDGSLEHPYPIGTPAEWDAFATLVGASSGSTQFTNCHSTATLNCTYNGFSNDGGFVGVNNGTLTFDRCSFKGSLLGTNTYRCGGFVGLNENTTATFTDCLFAPAAVTMGTNGSGTFVQPGSGSITNFTRTYYTTAFGAGQGTKVTAAAPDGICKPVVSAADGATYYSTACTVSGIAASYDLAAVPIHPEPVVKDGNTTLTKDVDYMLHWDEVSAADGDYTLTVTGMGSYMGLATVGYTVQSTTGTFGGKTFVKGKDGEGDFFVIATEEDLRNLSTAVNAGNNGSGKRFVQTADIDLSSGGNFTPIGIDYNTNKRFSGTYDGGHHAISGLKVSTSSGCAGLFGELSNGTVKNVRIMAPSVTSTEKISGAVVGRIRSGTVTQCITINPTISGGLGSGAISGLGNCTNSYYYGGNQTTSGTRVYKVTLSKGLDVATAYTGDGTDANGARISSGTYAGYYAAEGKTVTLAASDGYTIGSVSYNDGSGHDFCGTFDGQHNTLIVSLSGAQYVAPFFYVKSQDDDHPATIQNLVVDGTVTASGKFAAGIAGGCAEKVNITNCLVRTTISSSVPGDGTHGGLVGVFDGGTLNITGCAFTGKLLSTGSPATTKCGGIVGYSHVSGTAVNITNSLYAPAALVGSETEPTGDSKTFLRSENTTVTITNSYYTRTLGDAQGTTPYIYTTKPTGIGTEGTMYNVSGITAYTNGINQNGKYYTTPPDPAHFAQDGDEYTIKSATGWDVFCDLLGESETFSGKTVKLGDNISVTRMAGNANHRFAGTFDGQGNTLTVSYEDTGDYTMTAPFSYVDGATIRNLVVGGSITDTGYRAAGIIGETSENLSHITNCMSSVNISGGRYTAGFSIGGKVAIEGCVFNGKIVGTQYSGGFVGWSYSGLAITNCLFAPQDGSSISGGTFYYNGGGDITPTNSYYTTALGTPQGKAKHPVTAGTDVTVQVNPIGDATANYSVSGITAYAKGITRTVDQTTTFYYGQGDDVSLTLSNTAGEAPLGYQYNGFAASAGTLTGSNNPYTLTMPAEDVTISNTLAVIDWATESTGDSWNNAYMIYNKDQLDWLATRVNSGNKYENTYFKLGADITYSHTSDWDDTKSTENNYTAIGGFYNEALHTFGGHFDGQNHVVSGIRIYKEDQGPTSDYHGLFGAVSGENAEVRNVILADARITAGSYIAAIVGEPVNATISSCHALSNVTIHGAHNNNNEIGGIVGFNAQTDGYQGLVTGCTSAASLIKSSSGEANYYGGIVGMNNGTVSNCLYLGNKLGGNSGVGAIVGANSGTVKNCYFTDTAIRGKDYPGNTLDNANSAIGGNNATVADNVGLAPQDNADNSDFLTLMAARNTALTAVSRTTPLSTDVDITLNGRTLYKDGAWNTLCLPFGIDDFSGTPLEGATVMTLGNSEACNTGFDASTGTLNLDFLPADEIEPGVAYIVKWDGDGTNNLVNPTFRGVTIENENPAGKATVSQDYYVQFVGSYSPVGIYTEEHTKLYLGEANKLYYATKSMTINAFRAYFQLNNDLTAGDPSKGVRAFVLNFGDGDETQGISLTPDPSPKGEGSIYTLDGVKLDKMPTRKGVYIMNGRKVVVK